MFQFGVRYFTAAAAFVFLVAGCAVEAEDDGANGEEEETVAASADALKASCPGADWVPRATCDPGDKQGYIYCYNPKTDKVKHPETGRIGYSKIMKCTGKKTCRELRDKSGATYGATCK